MLQEPPAGEFLGLEGHAASLNASQSTQAGDGAGSGQPGKGRGWEEDKDKERIPIPKLGHLIKT